MRTGLEMLAIGFLSAFFYLGMQALASTFTEHTEIHVVSCPGSYIDVEGRRHTTYGPVAAYTLENDAEVHVGGQRGCSYTQVLLEPGR